MMWMLRSRRRRRKLLMLRRMMLRRKTDPKTGKHTLCEPAQSKCTWALHKSHFVWKFTGKVPDANPATLVLYEPAQSKCTRPFHKSHFVWKFTGKMAADTSGASILCEPAQSKCTWTCHKRYFVRKLTRKMPDAPDTTSIEHRALTLTVRTPQCGHTVWGIIKCRCLKKMEMK